MASRTLLLITANVLIPVAILIFASGFFPYKPFLSGLAQYEALEYGPPPDAPFDKVVFMVVDALRRYRNALGKLQGRANIGSDFVYSEVSGFEFTQRCVLRIP
jgi:ethanolamine phosphate transferase 2 subunit G